MRQESNPFNDLLLEKQLQFENDAYIRNYIRLDHEVERLLQIKRAKDELPKKKKRRRRTNNKNE